MYKINVLDDRYVIAKCDIINKTMEPGWGKDIVCRWNIHDVIVRSMPVDYFISKTDVKYSKGNIYEVLGSGGSTINLKDFYIFNEYECLSFIFNEF